MMDLKDLQYFLAVAQAGTITGAAAKLCMAQPPLSRQMKELEGQPCLSGERGISVLRRKGYS